MPLQPDVATFLGYVDNLPGPRIHEVDAATARQMTTAMRHVADLPTGPLAVLRDVTMPGPAGPIALRLFDTRSDRGPSPVLLFLHGGGWTVGDLDSYEPVCAEIARALDLPVVAVAYRLAPEAPWPAAPDDCEAAARWIAEAPAALGLSPTALLLAGDSAGGNLTIVTAMALRDAPAAAPVAAHWAIYPAADLAGAYPSLDLFGTGHFLTRETMGWFDRAYAADRAHWRGSPMAGSLADLPPALVTTAGADPLRDQGRAYAAALATAGVRVGYREAPGQIHGYINLRKALPSAAAAFAGDIAAFRSLIDEVIA